MCNLTAIDVNNKKVMVADIKKDYILNIVDSVRHCSAINKVVLFGSSTGDNCSEQSDIDIAVFGDKTKSSGSIGIVDYVYEDATKYWIAREERESGILNKIEKEKNRDNNNFICGRYEVGRYAWVLDNIKILDEPINGLDTDGMKIMREVLVDITQNHNCTILIASHILGELEKIATHYGIIRQGRMIQELTSADMDSRSRVFTKIKTKNLKEAKDALSKKYDNVRIKEESILVYDVDNTEEIVE